MNEIERAQEQLELLFACEEEYRKNYRIGLPPDLLFPALKTALKAIQEKAERENPKPLTLDELKKRHGKPVWCCEQNSVYPCRGWGIVVLLDPFGNGIHIAGTSFGFKQEFYGDWLAYGYEPKEEKE